MNKFRLNNSWIKCLAITLLTNLLALHTYGADRLRVGVFNVKPVIYMEKGEPHGLFADLLMGVSSQQGWELEFHPCSLTECVEKLRAGDLDMLLSMGRSDEREQFLSFSQEPVWSYWGLLYTQGSNIKTLSDVAGLRVAVRAGNRTTQALKKLVELSGYAVDFRPYDGYPEAFQALLSGEVDAVAANNTYPIKDIQVDPPIRRSDFAFNPFESYFAVARDRDLERFLPAIDQFVRTAKQNPDAAYYNFISEWFYEQPRGISYQTLATLLLFVVILATTIILYVGRQQALRASRSKSLFLANMSHEIRTPMNSVMGLAQVLTKPGRYSSEVVEHARKILLASKTLQTVIDDILDFSKIESGKLTLSLSPIRLFEIEESLAPLMSSVARDKQIELIIEPFEGGDLRLIGDQLRIQQILINLVSNAMKFTETGFVRVQVSSLDEGRSGRRAARLRFSVQDTGIGMTDAQRELVLEPFTQADPGTTRRYGGTGLGLTISQRLLALMGSELEIKSTPNTGSEVAFELALELAPDVANLATDQTAEPLNVLVADDQEISRTALRKISQFLGWQAQVVTGGVEAIERYRTQVELGTPFDLILMDWQMPDRDGVSAAQQIKAIAREQGVDHPPTIIMASLFEQMALEKVPGRNAIDLVLSKPITSSALRSAANQLLTEATSAPRPSGVVRAPLRGVRLLVVDDNSFNRDVAKMIFEAEGANVALVSHGQEAIDWLQNDEHNVDAVLMDVHMPVLDGLETTRVLHSDARFRHLPIIGMSASAYQSDIDNALEAGMNGYITKPINVERALDTLVKTIKIDSNTTQARDDSSRRFPGNPMPSA